MLSKLTLVALLSCTTLAAPGKEFDASGGHDGLSSSYGDSAGQGAGAGGDHESFKGFAYSHVNVYKPKTHTVPIYYQQHEEPHHGLQSQGGSQGAVFGGQQGSEGFGSHYNLHQGFGQAAAPASFNFGSANGGHYSGGEGSYSSSALAESVIPEFQEYNNAENADHQAFTAQLEAGNEQYGHHPGLQFGQGQQQGLFYPAPSTQHSYKY